MSWLLAGCAIGCFVKFLRTVSERDWRAADIGLGIVFLVQAVGGLHIFVLLIATWFTPPSFPSPYVGFAVVALWVYIILYVILVSAIPWCFLFRISWAPWVLSAVILFGFTGGWLSPEPNNPEHMKWREELREGAPVYPREVVLEDGETITVQEVTVGDSILLSPPFWAVCLVEIAALVYAFLRRRQTRCLGERVQHCGAAEHGAVQQNVT